jgi:hypothetical protein
MDTITDLLHRADEKRVKRLAQEILAVYFRDLAKKILVGILWFWGVVLLALGLLEFFRS